MVVVAVAIATLLLAEAGGASAQSRPNEDGPHFGGLYVGASVGPQNFFGGALINGIDVLAQGSRQVIEFSAGFRVQVLGDHLLAGAQVQYGLTNGDLTRFDPPSQSDVSYENGTQSGFGLTFGYVGGPSGILAVFAYGFATDRSFDIRVVDLNGSYRQWDGQSFLQYGLGAEVRVLGSWHVGASGGRQVVDFGDPVTNIELEKRFDLRARIVYQF